MVLRFTRFALVGGFATAIHYFVLVALVQLAGFGPVYASAIGFLISAGANYLLNYHYTFASSQPHGHALPKFFVLATIGLSLNSGIMSLLVMLGLHYVFAQMAATAIVLVSNFAGNSLWTFRTRAAGERYGVAQPAGESSGLSAPDP